MAEVRSVTPSLANTRTRWVLTVAFKMASCRPIARSVRPRATRVSTSMS
jgi:hypothetical protein